MYVTYKEALVLFLMLSGSLVFHISPNFSYHTNWIDPESFNEMKTSDKPEHVFL